VFTSLSKYAMNEGEIRGKRNAASIQTGCSGDPAPYHTPWSAVGCFDLSHLPNFGQKAKRLIKIVNTVPLNTFGEECASKCRNLGKGGDAGKSTMEFNEKKNFLAQSKSFLLKGTF